MAVIELKNILEKCDIYLDEHLISKEPILRSFWDFLSGESSKQENKGSIVLHLGSVCFDAIALVWATFAVILGNSTDVEKIVRSIRKGGQVLYRGERGEFKGIEIDSTGKEWAIIWQGNRGTRKVGRKSWGMIVPYQGNSKRYDGRGIRTKNMNREIFLSEVLECDKMDIPSITDSSVIFVMDRHRAERFLNGIEIKYGGIQIRILDLVTASYFTENNEYPYGGNAGKNEAMIKFTSKISTGLDMTYESDGNNHLGMFVCGNSIIENGITEIPMLMNRESLHFSVLSGGMDISCDKELLSQYQEAGVFACTKDRLSVYGHSQDVNNILTRELKRQVNAVMHQKIFTEIFSGYISWEKYKEFKTSLALIKQDIIDENEKSEIIISAWSLMNLFMTAPFLLGEMEEEIQTGKIGVDFPMKRMTDLENKLERLPQHLISTGKIIQDVLETLYYARCEHSVKRDYIISYLNENYHKKIAIVVPKAYYADILRDCVFKNCNKELKNVEIVSATRFDGTRTYDAILIVGSFYHKKFDMFRCLAAPQIIALLYDSEAIVFQAKKKRGIDREHILNNRQGVTNTEYSESEITLTNAGEEVFKIDEEIIRYNEEIITTKFDTAVRHGNYDLSTPFADVSTLVRFENGEGAMLTKRYEAYVLNSEKGEVEQKKADQLKAGDNLVFLNRDNDTRDIVDYILNELISSKKLSPQMIKFHSMSNQWKTDLANYISRTGESPARIAKKMIANGVKVQPGTIICWLDEDTHTVGPRNIESLEQIALLTENTDMFDHANDYFEACRQVRKLRISILKELGAAIIRTIEGENINAGLIPSEIHKKLDTMAMVLRIDSIVKTTRTVPAYLTNRPLDLEGGL